MQTKFPELESDLSSASLLRRLAAIFYDSLLCIALMFVVTGLYMMISHSILGPDTYRELNESGETINDPILTFLLGASLFGFFGYFWTKTGQTLGMQVWHIRVETNDGYSITWSTALIRWLCALFSATAFGLGYLLILIDKNKESFQCKASDTRIVRIPKRNKKNG